MKYENTVCLAFSAPRSEGGAFYLGSLRGGLRCTLLAWSLPGQHRQFGPIGDNYQRRARSLGMAAHVDNSDSFSGSRFPFTLQRSGVFVQATRIRGPALVPSDKADNLWQIVMACSGRSDSLSDVVIDELIVDGDFILVSVL